MPVTPILRHVHALKAEHISDSDIESLRRSMLDGSLGPSGLTKHDASEVLISAVCRSDAGRCSYTTKRMNVAPSNIIAEAWNPDRLVGFLRMDMDRFLRLLEKRPVPLQGFVLRNGSEIYSADTDGNHRTVAAKMRGMSNIPCEVEVFKDLVKGSYLVQYYNEPSHGHYFDSPVHTINVDDRVNKFVAARVIVAMGADEAIYYD